MNISPLSVFIMIMCFCTASCFEENEEKERVKGRPCRFPKGSAGSVRRDGCLQSRCSGGKWKPEMRSDVCCYNKKDYPTGSEITKLVGEDNCTTIISCTNSAMLQFKKGYCEAPSTKQQVEKLEKKILKQGDDLSAQVTGNNELLRLLLKWHDPECGMVVKGRSFGDNNPSQYWIDSLMFSAYHVVTDEEDFWYDYETHPSEPTSTNYWITDDGMTGQNGRLYMFFACARTIRGFLIKNTHNWDLQDRGTNFFKIFTSSSGSGPWTEILSDNLPDARNVTHVPVLQFPMGSPITTQYVMFQIESHYGHGGGLQYFATY